MQIRKAARQHRPLKIGIGGISGSGKTLGALKVAHGICGDWEKICVIDSENASADLYAHLGGFSKIDLDEGSPQKYMAAIKAAIDAGFDVVVIDSLSHEWSGPGGLLEQVEKINAASKSGNSYAAWGKATPLHNQFVQSWLGAKAHVIATLRKKDDYVLEQNKHGKTAPKKVGLKNIQRDGLDYEFDLLIDINREHTCTVEKDRTMIFDGEPPFELTEEVGKKLVAWSQTGEAPPVTPPEIKKPAAEVKPSEQTKTTAAKLFDPNDSEQQQKVANVLKRQHVDEQHWEEICNRLAGKPGSKLGAIVSAVLADAAAIPAPDEIPF